MTTASQTITVIQGDFAVSSDPNVIMSTVLGSCVAVCLFEPQAAVGGMNHFLLAGSNQTSSDDLKYGVNAMELLINRVLRAGGERRLLRAKLFGGARMTEHSRDIGQSNAVFARDFLDQEGIVCVSESLGGTQARRVQFTPSTGAARQMQVAGAAPEVSPPKRPVPSPADITLF
jgi:chemotaxis protein CheD